MTVTIGAFSTNRLLAQPFGYEGDARTGLTARTFRISGLLTPAEWQTLVSEYNSWRSTRLTDADTFYSGTVGTTIPLTITSTNNLSVTNLACWFTDPPAGEQAGIYVSATVTLVDANQALSVLLREKEKSRENSEATTPDFGTLQLGSGAGAPIVKLTAPMLTRRDGPNVALTPTGVSYVTGPRTSHKVRVIEGYLTQGTFDGVLAWYDDIITKEPVNDTWFPVEAPTSTAEVVIVNGVKSTRTSVKLTAVQVMKPEPV